MKKLLWLIIFFSGLIASGINPADTFTWFLEVLPAMIAIVALALSYKKFPLTSLSYFLILIHCLILMLGGHYTYAEVPLGDWVSQFFGWERNNYDKLGHLAQGFIPAIIAREILIRRQVMKSISWTHFFCVCFCLAFSALYELIEWWTALFSGEDADAFLGTQGYVWDTQSDMFLALIGAILALLLLSKLHNKQLSDMQHLKSSSA